MLGNIRTFDVPQINFNANDYTEIIDWEKLTKTVPPILRKFNFNINDAKTYARKKLCEYELGFDLMKLPCHTQAVERCVKAVTEASQVVCGEERRNGLILNTLQSRQDTPIFRTKSNFYLNYGNVPQMSI